MEKQLNQMQDFYDSCHEWRMNDSFMDCMRFILEQVANEWDATHGKMQTSSMAGESAWTWAWTMRMSRKCEERTREWEDSNDFHLEQPVNASDNKRGIWLR